MTRQTATTAAPDTGSALIQIAPALFVGLWATGFIGAKYGLTGAEPLTFLSYRFAIVVTLLAAICLVWRPRTPTTPALAAHCFLAGALIHGFYLGGTFLAVSKGLQPAIAALIVGLQPLVTAVLAAPILGERISARHWIGVSLGFVGLALVLGPKMTGATLEVTPEMIAFAVMSLAGITVGTIYQKNYATGASLRVGGLLQYLGGLSVTAVGATLFESWRIDWTPQVIGAMAWLVLVLSLGAISLLMLMIRNGAVSRVSTLFYLVPPVTAVMAYVLFGDTLTALQLLGMLITAIAVALVVSQPPHHDQSGNVEGRTS